MYIWCCCFSWWLCISRWSCYILCQMDLYRAQQRNGCSAVVFLLFIGFWFMRGLRKLDGCFPWFHYITLVFELIAHMISYESDTLTEESKNQVYGCQVLSNNTFTRNISWKELFQQNNEQAVFLRSLVWSIYRSFWSVWYLSLSGLSLSFFVLVASSGVPGVRIQTRARYE